ncbi:zinc ribbon domain-containing protein [Streptomyces sp.]
MRRLRLRQPGRGSVPGASQQCCECGYTDIRDRALQARFRCRSCGVVAHADLNASRNIARKGDVAWAAGRESRVPVTSRR